LKYPDFVEKLRDVVGLYVDPPEQLIEVITAYIDRRNVGPKPSIWIATVQHILEKVTKRTPLLRHYTSSPESPPLERPPRA
jgi:hypothetical protein